MEEPPIDAAPASEMDSAAPEGADDPEAEFVGLPIRLIRRKGHLSRRRLAVLLAIGGLPLVLMMLKLTALPGLVGSGVEAWGSSALRGVGGFLNETFSLGAIPPDRRSHALYLLLVPTYALLIVLARLTLGIRVLGFRSILLTVGFQEVGILRGLFLLTAVLLTVAAVRPLLKQARLPYYARLSVILSLVAMTMVGMLVVGPWMRSEFLWGVPFFPVIVLGMLAEGIVNSLNRDRWPTTVWRAGTTILLSFLMISLGKIPAVLETLLQFPELLLTEVIAIILVSEFMDFRLFGDWDAKMAGMAVPKLFSNPGAYRVAVVRNRDQTGIIARRGRLAPKKLTQVSVQRLVDALRARGHTVEVFEGDMSLLGELRRFLPEHPRTGEPGGIVFNLAHGIQGEGRYTHVPAMLEMAGIPYTGPSPSAQAVISDKLMGKMVMQEVGIATPPFFLMTRSSDVPGRLEYPLVVKPRHETRYRLCIARDARELKQAVRAVRRKHRQELLVEEYVPGLQINAALLGNDPVECLPLVGVDPETQEKVCPAPIEEPLAARIRIIARQAFAAFGCRDFARIDFRITEFGQPLLVEVNTIGILDHGGSFARAAAAAGCSYGKLLQRILIVSRKRYLAEAAARWVGIGAPVPAPARKGLQIRMPPRKRKPAQAAKTKHRPRVEPWRESGSEPSTGRSASGTDPV